uniref:Uncharacterized protein n=1 Tax=Ditylenchus dipsaci TaxID=166011 RepID=A0A915EN75_9BILA
MVKWTEASRLRLIEEYRKRPQLYENPEGLRRSAAKLSHKPLIRHNQHHKSEGYQRNNSRSMSSRNTSSQRQGTSKRPASSSPETDQENEAKRAAPIDWARFLQEMSAKGDPHQRQPFTSGPVASTPMSGEVSSSVDVSDRSNEVENQSPEAQNNLLRHFRSDASDASSSMPDIKNVRRLHPLLASMYRTEQQSSVPAVRRSTIKSEALGQSIQLSAAANNAAATTIRRQIREPFLEPVLTLAIRPPVEVEPISREQHDDLPEYMVVEDEDDENFEKFGTFVANTLKRLFTNFPRCAVRAKNNVRDLLFQTELRKLQNGYAHV